jgi:hypothetical protein
MAEEFSEGSYMEEFNFSLALVKAAGNVIKTAINKAKVVSEKSSATDLGKFNFSLALDVIKTAISKAKVVSEKSSATDLGKFNF